MRIDDMKIGVMQPYFIPYLGYWQLINAVDKYVIYDDVNYINRGWVNRNRILVNGTPKYITIPLTGASQNKKINELQIDDTSKIIKKNWKMIENVYKKAPYYKDVIHVVDEIRNCREKKLVSFIQKTFSAICGYLDIETEMIVSSSLDKNNTLSGQEKILNICELLGATEYYNAIGGQMLYQAHDFEARGIELKFLKTKPVIYKQYENEFQPNLSILDVMMFNSGEEVKKLLNEYVLIDSD